MTTQEEDRVSRKLRKLLADKRWFRGKARKVDNIELLDHIPFSAREEDGAIVLARITYEDLGSETYALYLLESRKGRTVTLSECVSEPISEQALRALLNRGAVLHGALGDVSAAATPAAQRDLAPSADPLAVRLLVAEQSNTSLVFGDQYLLKLYRRVEPGVQPDLEVSRFLTSHGFLNAPELAGNIVYRKPSGEEITLGMLQHFVKNQGDGWQLALGALKAAFVRATASSSPVPRIPSKATLLELARSEPPDGGLELLGDHARWIKLLGRRTGELHLVLASDPSDPAFAPEPFTERARMDLRESIESLCIQAMSLIRDREPKLRGPSREALRRVLSLEAAIRSRFEDLLLGEFASSRIRCHGDYHLGQVLIANSDIVITDFEGEVTRPITERRAKHSPLRDVAGMLRSFHYASRAATADFKAAEVRRLEPWAKLWRTSASALFLGSYLEVVRAAPFFPGSDAETQRLLDAYLLEKTLYEVAYEFNHRPTWAAIPVEGLLELVGDSPQGRIPRPLQLHDCLQDVASTPAEDPHSGKGATGAGPL